MNIVAARSSHVSTTCINAGMFQSHRSNIKSTSLNHHHVLKKKPTLKWSAPGNFPSFFHGNTGKKNAHICRFQSLVPVKCAGAPVSASPSISESGRRLKVIGWCAVTLVLSVANAVLHKLALVPMKNYPFFLALLNSFLYVGVYFSMLHLRYRAGITTHEMIAIPKLPFVLIGFLEAISILLFMYSGAMLPGPVIPLLYQTFLVWQLVFSYIFLRRRYSFHQLLGCFLVASGVVVAVTSGSGNGEMLSAVGIVWPLLMLASCAFQAGASIVKESVFLDASSRLKGKLLDIFVVNSFGSAFQVLFMLLFVPILSKLEGIPLSELPLYFTKGAVCFLNLGTNTTTGCDGAPLLPILYMISNMLFDISMLSLLKFSNAVVSSLVVRSSVPFAIYVLSLPLPYLPGGVILSHSFHVGAFILVIGLVLYNISWIRKQNSDVQSHFSGEMEM